MKRQLSHVTCWFLLQGPIRSPENWSWLAYIALQGSLFGQHHFRKWYCPLKRGQYHFRRWYCPLFFFFFKKESRHSRQGNVHVLGLLLPKKCRRRRLQSSERSSARTAMARSWAMFFCLRWVVISSSCDFLWRQNGEHRASSAFGVSAISFWPSEGRRVGSSKRSSRRAFEIAQSKTEASRGSTKQCSNCKFTT